MNIYVKLFLGAGTPFGLIMGLVFGLQHGLGAGAGVALWSGGAFGLIFALIAGPLHAWSRKRAGVGGEPDKAAARSIIEVDQQAEALFDSALRDMEALDKIEITKQDPENGLIEAEAGQTWKSWGETITVRMVPVHEGRTRVELSSRSSVRTTLIDFGKNAENIRLISDILRS